MKRQIRNYSKAFAAIIGLMAIGLIVAGVILSNQRFHLPGWVPVLGSDFVDYKAEFATAQSITPGQGQTVNIAGVPVGEISGVRLRGGRAVVTMKIRKKYTPIYRDASALLRPKTGLNDMVIELEPGTTNAGRMDPGRDEVVIDRTLANVNTDEVLAGLDQDTRNYLQLLLKGASEGLSGNGKNLSAALKRFEPTNRDVLKLTSALETRRSNIKRSVSNFRKLVEAVGAKDDDLAQLVNASNAVFASFSAQDANLRKTLGLLPDTLQDTNTALAKTDKLAKVLGPTLGELRPAARALGPSLKKTRPFVRKTTPVIRDQLRPFARDTLPVLRTLRPTAKNLADVTPSLTKTFTVANYVLNELAYNPKGDDEGYLFWLSWLGHLGPTLFGVQDSMGPIRRGAILVSCSGLTTLDQIRAVNPQLATVIDLLNPVTKDQACANTGTSVAAKGAK